MGKHEATRRRVKGEKTNINQPSLVGGGFIRWTGSELENSIMGMILLEGRVKQVVVKL